MALKELEQHYKDAASQLTGYLGASFDGAVQDESVSAVHEQAAAENLQRFNLEIAVDENSPLPFQRRLVQRKDVRANVEKSYRDIQRLLLQQQINDNLRAIDQQIEELERIARWYHEHAQIAADRMDQIAGKMGDVSDFINKADEILDKKKFDREKALELLKHKGISPSKNITNAQLSEMLSEQKSRALNERHMLGQDYETWRNVKDDFTRKASETDTQVEERRKRREEIKKIPDDEERRQASAAFEREGNAVVEHSTNNLETDQKTQQERDRDFEQKYNAKAQTVDESASFLTAAFGGAVNSTTAQQRNIADKDIVQQPLVQNVPGVGL